MRTLSVTLLLCFITNMAVGQSSSDSPAETATDFSRNRILYYGAANFDFGGTTTATSVNHFNIMLEDISGTSFALNTGIMRLRYSGLDTFNGTQFLLTQNIPLESTSTIPVAGQRYERRLSSVSQTLRRTDLSFYVQPMIRLLGEDEDADCRVWAHGHLEMLASQFTGNQSEQLLKSDTPQYNPADRTVFSSGLFSSRNYDVLRVYGYFGGGITSRFAISEQNILFLQGTVGTTNDNPRQQAQDIIAGATQNSSGQWAGFYLVRGYFLQKLSSQSYGVIGVDIRGNLPAYTPRYAAYIGVTLDLTSIFNH